MRGPTGHLYYLMGIPATFRPNPEGCVAKNLQGTALKQELARRLQQLG
jgi:hypothetical protein